MGTHKLKKNQFDAIRRELLEGNRPQAIIAADYQTSSTMISVVNNARTWGNYQSGTKAKHPLRGPVKPVEPSKFEKAEKQGLKPQDRVDRATKKLGVELDALNRTPTREEFNMLTSRLDLQARQVSYLARLPIIGSAVRKQLQEASADHYKAHLGR